MINAYDIQLEAEKGCSFDFVLECKQEDGSPWDLTGFEATFKIENSEKETVVTLTDGDGTSIGGEDVNIITVVMTPAKTADLTHFIGKHELIIESGTETIKLLKGVFVLNRSLE